jgi:RNA polymerase sigma-70 factor (ECF subfamily)
MGMTLSLEETQVQESERGLDPSPQTSISAFDDSPFPSLEHHHHSDRVLHEMGDEALLVQVRAGDERAFATLVTRYHHPMLYLARSFVPSMAVAEDVVQDTWLAMHRGIGKFEGRCSFRTWLLRILVNRAKTTGVRERRSIAVGAAPSPTDDARFDRSGQWESSPQYWAEDSDNRMLAGSMFAYVQSAIDALPAQQREVVTMRDVGGFSCHEVCSMLEISEGNQRVLLHRGRSRVRQLAEAKFRSA